MQQRVCSVPVTARASSCTERSIGFVVSALSAIPRFTINDWRNSDKLVKIVTQVRRWTFQPIVPHAEAMRRFLIGSLLLLASAISGAG